MITKGREVIFRERIINDFQEIEEIVGQNNPAKGRAYVSELYNFCLEIICPFPNAYPKLQIQDFSINAIRKSYVQKGVFSIIFSARG
jgi:hypothetical protein